MKRIPPATYYINKVLQIKPFHRFHPQGERMGWNGSHVLHYMDKWGDLGSETLCLTITVDVSPVRGWLEAIICPDDPASRGRVCRSDLAPPDLLTDASRRPWLSSNMLDVYQGPWDGRMQPKRNTSMRCGVKRRDASGTFLKRVRRSHEYCRIRSNRT